MWFLGLMAGLFLGVMFQSIEATLVLSLVGACIGAVWRHSLKRLEKTPVKDDAPATALLMREIAALTARVHALEVATLHGEVGQPIATPPRVLSDVPVPLASVAAVPVPPIAPMAPVAPVNATRSVAETAPPQYAETIRPAVVAASPLPVGALTASAPPAPVAEPVERSESAESSRATPGLVHEPTSMAVQSRVSAAAPVVQPRETVRAAVHRAPPVPQVPWQDRLPAPVHSLLFGGNMLVKLGVLILFLGLAFLLRYTAERVTVPVELRYAGVALAGAALLALGWFLRHRRQGYALTLQGAGIGVFYLTTLAAMKLHGLVPADVGFGFLFAVAVLSAVLAVVQNAPMLAVVAALEGFAAPVLASTGSNNPVGLFTYLLVLDVGILLVAWFRAWRPLHLIGLTGTFTLAVGWAQKYYTNDQYDIAQPYLMVFFLLFTAIGVLFARRTLQAAPTNGALPLAARAEATLRRVGRVDSALVFGVPMVAFGMQYVLVRHWEIGAAFSALGLGLFYLLLARWVFSARNPGLALLAEAYVVIGAIFGTLAIPLGLEGQWTGASWAVEAAGMYWLGVRQLRPYARGFAFVVLAGAVVKLLQSTAVSGLDDGPLLVGSSIGPIVLASSAIAVWILHRRARLDSTVGWEASCARVLPWLGLASLVLLPWQWFTPDWAAVATAVMAVAVFAVAMRRHIAALRPVSHALQILAVVGFAGTLHRGGDHAVLQSGWQGMAAAGVIAACVLLIAGWAMLQVQRQAQARSALPSWSVSQTIGILAGVTMLHLAMLFGASAQQVAWIWPLSSLLVFWIALRMVHAPMAMLAAGLQVVSATLFVVFGSAAAVGATAFANAAFWTPMVLAFAALVGGDWVRGEAARLTALQKEKPAMPQADEASKTMVRPVLLANGWCASPLVLWAPLVWGLIWWLTGSVVEMQRLLLAAGNDAYLNAGLVAVVLLTSAAVAQMAQRRSWLQMGQATAATLPALGLVVLTGLNTVGASHYVASDNGGWLVWPLALVWHLMLLRRQSHWLPVSLRTEGHIAGMWFFLLLAARECQWHLATAGDTWSAWPLLGWVAAPVLLLALLRSQAVLRRWPLTEFRKAYLQTAATPVAVYLLAWVWTTNIASAGSADPLPYVPLFNPLEMAHALVLMACVLWWRALPPGTVWNRRPELMRGLAAATGLALLSGVVLRCCHHWAHVPWAFSDMYDSWLAQAAISIAWALCGVTAMVLGNRKLSRGMWISGAGLLGVVVLKLFVVELANQGGLFRIVSFIAVGALLLVVGYFAPAPPLRRKEIDLQPAAGHAAAAASGENQ